MTYGDLLDTLVRDSGDSGTDYRLNAVTWLNLVRQEAAARGRWSSAKNSQASITTDASNTTGVYTLTGFDSIIGDEMYDQTNNSLVCRDNEMRLREFDADANEYGFPTLWSDSGMSALGEKQIRFWPIPNDAFVIGFIGSRMLIDVTTANEDVSIDPYFGPLSTVGAMLQKGLRFFHDLNNNEDAGQVERSKNSFYAAIKLYSGNSGADSVQSSRLDPVNRISNQAPMGRLNPSHYSNR